MLLGWCLLRGRPLRYPLRAHGRFAFIGLFLFNLNYITLYYATFHLTTGLVSVIFSSIQIFNMVISRLVLGDQITLKMTLGAAIGIGGITLVFLPELQLLEWSSSTLTGILFALTGTISASVGMISSARFQRENYPVLQTNAWGMTWGALLMLVYIIINDIEFGFQPDASYIGSLIWLSIFATALGFGCFLTLVGRIGAGRASYAMVVFPIVALFISTLFENYTWSVTAVLGLALAIGGNVIILMDRQAASPRKPTPS